MSYSILRVLRYDFDTILRHMKTYGIANCSRVLSTAQAVVTPDSSSDGDKKENKNVTKNESGGIEIPRSSSKSHLRFVYPEFLPDPTIDRRNPIREKLERRDMLKRRVNVDIPEFYTGSVMAVTRSNEHAPEKSSRFLGICIQRLQAGLRSEFTLRNVIEGLGVEMKFYLYDPTIQKIEVLRLEKRLDEELLYLRDALPEFSTFPLDMETEFLPEGTPVPVNPLKVKLKRRPWCARWERAELKGVDQATIEASITDKMRGQRDRAKKPWEKYDLMKQYRATIPEEEQSVIFAEVSSELHRLELNRKKLKKRREFVKPKKAG